MSKIDGFRPSEPPLPPDDSKKISESVKNSTETQRSEQPRAELDWSQPGTPKEVLSNLFSKIMIAACANKILG